MNRLIVNADQASVKISKHIYGHFAEHLGRCIYEGIWVGEDSPIPNTRGIRNDVVAALKKLNMPNLRWPGGCFADTYHWKDGIGPRESRPSIVNIHWGGTTENNHFGTHEFLDLCEHARLRALHLRQRRLRHRAGDGRVARVHHHAPPARARWPSSASRTAGRSPGSSSTGPSATRTGAAAATCAPQYYADRLPPVPVLLPALRRRPEALQGRLRLLGRLERGPDARRPPGSWTASSVHYYTVPGRRLDRQGLRHPVQRRRVVRHAQESRRASRTSSSSTQGP